jgi:hypothetical protein
MCASRSSVVAEPAFGCGFCKAATDFTLYFGFTLYSEILEGGVESSFLRVSCARYIQE